MRSPAHRWRIVWITAAGVVLGTVVAFVVILVLAGIRGLLAEYGLRWIVDVAIVLILAADAYRGWRKRRTR